jgi:hypothetical protein
MSKTSVSMGGVLNEDEDGSDIPVDVTAALAEMGVLVPAGIDELIDELARRANEPRQRVASS